MGFYITFISCTHITQKESICNIPLFTAQYKVFAYLMFSVSVPESISSMINFLHLRIYSNPVLLKGTLNLGFLILFVHDQLAQHTLTLLFCPKREEVVGCRELDNEELHEFFSSPNAI